MKSNKNKYNALVKDLHAGMMEAEQEMAAEGIEVGGSEMGYSVAEDSMSENPWITTFLKAMGVQDVKGRFVDDIYRGRGV